MTFDDYYNILKDDLGGLYDAGEAAAIAGLVLEHFTGKRSKPFSSETITEQDAAKLLRFQQELLTGKPVQYVLGEAWFLNRKFLVNESVLIPRPETEELVMLAIETLEKKGFLQQPVKIIDIGTGSGCIAISLARMLPAAEVTGADISAAALETARHNGEILGASVTWKTFDFLDKQQWEGQGMFDLLISNPPYIPENEKSVLEKNVVDWEPHAALFTPENDPLIFYRMLALFAQSHLKQGGLLMVEGHQQYMNQVSGIFNAAFGNCTIINDINNNPRMAFSSRI